MTEPPSPFESTLVFFKNMHDHAAGQGLLIALEKYANNLEHYNYLGRWYHEFKDYDRSLYWTQRAYGDCRHEDARRALRSNLAKLHNVRNEPQESLSYLKENEPLDTSPAHTLEKAFSLFLLNQKPQAERLLRELLTEDLSLENRNRVLFNLGTYDLINGHFKRGLKGFLIYGKKLGIWSQIQLPEEKFWSGFDRPTDPLIVVAEGGIGDEIISVRFMRHLKERGMNPIWFTQRTELRHIFYRCGFTTTDTLEALPANYRWTYSMSLPVFLNLSESDLWDGPYLSAIDKDLKLFRKPGTHIGIKWSGNPLYDQDLHRRLPLRDLLNAISDERTTLYSLEKDLTDSDRKILEEYQVVDLKEQLNTYDDTLSIISKLDLVVTSCTSIAHATSAIGHPCVVLVPITAYYTWCSTHDRSSIWYGDTTVVLRQQKNRDWSNVFLELKNNLEDFL